MLYAVPQSWQAAVIPLRGDQVRDASVFGVESRRDGRNFPLVLHELAQQLLQEGLPAAGVQAAHVEPSADVPVRSSATCGETVASHAKSSMVLRRKVGVSSMMASRNGGTHRINLGKKLSLWSFIVTSSGNMPTRSKASRLTAGSSY